MASCCNSILNGKLVQHVKNLGVIIILHLTIFVSLNPLFFFFFFFLAVLLTWCICIFQIICPTPGPWPFCSLAFVWTNALYCDYVYKRLSKLELHQKKRSFQTWKRKNKSKTMKISSFELPNAFLLWPHPLTLHSGVINPSAGFSNFTDFSHLKACILLSQFTTISWVLLHRNHFC